MAILKSISIVFVVAFIVSLSSTAVVDGANGSLVTLDPKDPYVVKLAEFAVSKYKKDRLHLEHVLKADYNKDSRGRTYKLDIEARGVWTVGNYSAVLLVRGFFIFKKVELVSFTRLP